jgi:hypothetical protein
VWVRERDLWWRFPEELVRVVSHHHGWGNDTDPLLKIVGIAQTFWTCPEEALAAEAIILLPERRGIEEQVEEIAGQL